MIRDIPMDVWSRVATFLPDDDRVPAFWALRASGVIAMDEPFFRSCMAFLRESLQHSHALAEQEVEDAIWPRLDDYVTEADTTTLQEMGFAREDAVRALVSTGGNIEYATRLLIRGL